MQKLYKEEKPGELRTILVNRNASKNNSKKENKNNSKKEKPGELRIL